MPLLSGVEVAREVRGMGFPVYILGCTGNVLRADQVSRRASPCIKVPSQWHEVGHEVGLILSGGRVHCRPCRSHTRANLEMIREPKGWRMVGFLDLTEHRDLLTSICLWRYTSVAR
jgi:hypothetical protein